MVGTVNNQTSIGRFTRTDVANGRPKELYNSKGDGKRAASRGDGNQSFPGHELTLDLAARKELSKVPAQLARDFLVNVRPPTREEIVGKRDRSDTTLNKLFARPEFKQKHEAYGKNYVKSHMYLLRTAATHLAEDDPIRRALLSSDGKKKNPASPPKDTLEPTPFMRRGAFRLNKEDAKRRVEQLKSHGPAPDGDQRPAKRALGVQYAFERGGDRPVGMSFRHDDGRRWYLSFKDHTVDRVDDTETGILKLHTGKYERNGGGKPQFDEVLLRSGPETKSRLGSYTYAMPDKLTGKIEAAIRDTVDDVDNYIDPTGIEKMAAAVPDVIRDVGVPGIGAGIGGAVGTLVGGPIGTALGAGAGAGLAKGVESGVNMLVRQGLQRLGNEAIERLK